MATERLSMRHTRDILRQKWVLGLPHRAIAQSLGISSGAVGTTMLRAQAAGLDWAEVQRLDDDGLEARLYGRPEVVGTPNRPAPDCAWLHAERRKPGVTLELLRLEYLEPHPDGYRYERHLLYEAPAKYADLLPDSYSVDQAARILRVSRRRIRQRLTGTPRILCGIKHGNS